MDKLINVHIWPPLQSNDYKITFIYCLLAAKGWIKTIIQLQTYTQAYSKQ